MKEKTKKVTTFVKEHKTEVLLTAATGTLAVICYKNRGEIIELTNKILKVTDVAKRSINREIERITFEIADLTESIERLDPSIPINKNHTIPRRLERIEELKIQLAELYIDRDKL